MGSLTFGVRAVHTKGVRHKQVCTELTRMGQKKLPLTCPAKASNPGSSELNSDALTVGGVGGGVECDVMITLIDCYVVVSVMRVLYDCLSCFCKRLGLCMSE